MAASASRGKLIVAAASDRGNTVSASSVSVCWYVASFRKGGSSEPNKLPLNPPLHYMGQVAASRYWGYKNCVCLLEIFKGLIVPSVRLGHYLSPWFYRQHIPCVVLISIPKNIPIIILAMIIVLYYSRRCSFTLQDGALGGLHWLQQCNGEVGGG